MMNQRVNHKLNLKENFISKNFWDEFVKRGFSVNPSNDGVYFKNTERSKLTRDRNGSYELKIGMNSKINIVSAQNFMRTIARIEGMVKYKLFE